MHHGRKRLIALLSTSVLATGVLIARPAMAEPDIEDVKQRVDRLYHEAEQASERYNDVQLELTELRQDLRSLRSDERRQTRRLHRAQEQVEDSVIASYQGDNVASMSDVLVADDPSAFLADLTTMSSVTDIQAERFERFAAERRALQIRTRATDRHVAEVEQAEQQAREEKRTIDARAAKAKDLLAELEAEERARLAAIEERRAERTVSRSEVAAESAPEPSTNAPASGRAGAAVQYALSQVGDAYVYGAAGPNAFDCSGLTMMAWAQAGVGLPHSSGAQMGSGTRVGSGNLQPGDLVFYYSPVSHVGIYIGNGQIVHAANPSTGVSVTGVFSMPFSGAVRPG